MDGQGGACDDAGSAGNDAQPNLENVAMATKSDAVWFEIDPASLNAKLLTAYEEYKATYRRMKEKRESFEMLMAEQADVPEGKRMVFGYNFGKLSVAMVDDDRKAKAKASPKQSLADFLASAQASGRRV